MAVTATPYGAALLHLGAGRLNFTADTFKVLLTTSAYTPNVDTHDYLDDITNEIVGTGYTAGGATLAGLTWTYDAASNTARLTASPTTWATATLVARRAVVYKSTGTASTSPLVSYVDFDEDKSPTAIDFTLTWSEDGLLTVALPA